MERAKLANRTLFVASAIVTGAIVGTFARLLLPRRVVRRRPVAAAFKPAVE